MNTCPRCSAAVSPAMFHCGACGQPLVVGASPGGARLPLLLAVFAAGALVAGLGAVLYVRSTRDSNSPATTTTTTLTLPTPAAPQAGAPSPLSVPSSVGEPPMPQQPAASAISFAMPIVHFHAGVDEPAAALGQPDHHSAIVRAGMLTLQMPAGQQLVSDGTPAADVRVEVDPATPGPYRVEIGVGHNEFVVVADGVSASQMIDVDAAGVRIGRFVRVSTRASGANVAVDAVLVRIPSSPVAPST
ncbi:MAG: hypothetical protein U0326_09370 [Polyangiales bacterium]